MAQDDPYNPDYANIADTNTTTFDGSASSTDAAVINEIAGNEYRIHRLAHSQINRGHPGSHWAIVSHLGLKRCG